MTEADTPADVWALVFVAEAGPVPTGRRVDQVLKYAKRVQGLRCASMSSTTLPEQLARSRDEVIELREQLAKASKPRKVNRSSAASRCTA